MNFYKKYIENNRKCIKKKLKKLIKKNDYFKKTSFDVFRRLLSTFDVFRRLLTSYDDFGTI